MKYDSVLDQQSISGKIVSLILCVWKPCYVKSGHILTGRTKTSFSHLCISVITYLIVTKFATQLPASQGSLHSKFEGNRSSHFRDTSCQNFVFFLRVFSSSSSSFRTLAKIAITSKRVLSLAPPAPSHRVRVWYA